MARAARVGVWDGAASLLHTLGLRAAVRCAVGLITTVLWALVFGADAGAAGSCAEPDPARGPGRCWAVAAMAAAAVAVVADWGRSPALADTRAAASASPKPATSPSTRGATRGGRPSSAGTRAAAGASPTPATSPGTRGATRPDPRAAGAALEHDAAVRVQAAFRGTMFGRRAGDPQRRRLWLDAIARAFFVDTDTAFPWNGMRVRSKHTGRMLPCADRYMASSGPERAGATGWLVGLSADLRQNAVDRACACVMGAFITTLAASGYPAWEYALGMVVGGLRTCGEEELRARGEMVHARAAKAWRAVVPPVHLYRLWRPAAGCLRESAASPILDFVASLTAEKGPVEMRGEECARGMAALALTVCHDIVNWAEVLAYSHLLVEWDRARERDQARRAFPSVRWHPPAAECVCCMSAADSVWGTCGHQTLCASCSDRWCEQGTPRRGAGLPADDRPTCPTCRSPSRVTLLFDPVASALDRAWALDGVGETPGLAHAGLDLVRNAAVCIK